MKIDISVDCDTDTMSEEWLLDFCFKLWELTHIRQSARTHFADRFNKAHLPCTEQHISNLLSGRTRPGDVAWSIVIHDADGAGKPIAAATRKRWLESCEKKASTQ